MSAEIPEVGDVWKFAHNLYYLILSFENDSVMVLRNDSLRALKVLPCQLGEYLGKSKANINELFEVRDD